jgi:hypothetical protein
VKPVSGVGRKAGDRRRQRVGKVVATAHTGRAAGSTTSFRESRVTEFKTGFSSGKNGRA